MVKLGTIMRGSRGKWAGNSISTGANGTVMREIVTPSNPKTEAQRIQRAIYRTANKSYQFMSAICDHSFQGKTRKNDNMSEFMSINLRQLRAKVSKAQQEGLINNCVNFYPEGQQTLLPVDVVVSNGSLPQIPVKVIMASNNGVAILEGLNFNTGMTYADIINHYGLRRGDQLTFVAVHSRVQGGGWEFIYARVILDPRGENGQALPLSSAFLSTEVEGKYAIANTYPYNQGDIFLVSGEGSKTNFIFTDVNASSIAAAGVIVSRKGNNNWQRSYCKLAFNDDAAVDTYNIVEASAEMQTPIYTASDQYLNEAEGSETTSNIGDNDPTIESIGITVTSSGPEIELAPLSEGGDEIASDLHSVIINGSNLDASSFKVSDGLHEATFSPVDGAPAGTKIQANPNLTRADFYQFTNIWHKGSPIYNITIVPTA